MAIAELQFQSPGSGAQAKANTEDPLVGTYKIGFWYDSESFADLRYDTAGLPLGNPANNQTPARHRGNYAFYAVADQMIWRGADPDRNINVFVRPMFTPLEDRNLISFELNAGLTMRDPLQGRKDDTAGLAMGVVRVSNSATGFNQDSAFYNPGVFSAIRTNETFLEATYQYQLMPSTHSDRLHLMTVSTQLHIKRSVVYKNNSPKHTSSQNLSSSMVSGLL